MVARMMTISAAWISASSSARRTLLARDQRPWRSRLRFPKGAPAFAREASEGASAEALA
jgi:hypothetical protein